MFITVTSSRPSPDQLDELERFLSEFLPKLERQPGVVAVYHYNRPESGDDYTIIIWRDEQSVIAYRESALIKEPMDFEKQHGLVTTREVYPLNYPPTK